MNEDYYFFSRKHFTHRHNNPHFIKQSVNSIKQWTSVQCSLSMGYTIENRSSSLVTRQFPPGWGIPQCHDELTETGLITTSSATHTVYLLVTHFISHLKHELVLAKCINNYKFM